MNDILTDKNHMIAISRLPFMENFPFPEFDIVHKELTVFDGSSATLQQQNIIDVIIFTCTDGVKATIRILESDIWMIHGAREYITKLNVISNSINSAMASNDVIVKRNTILEFEAWFQILKGKLNIGVNTFIEILHSFIAETKGVESAASVELALARLRNQKGVVVLDEHQESVLVNYFQFQLIYYKLILGIIIAAKLDDE